MSRKLSLAQLTQALDRLRPVWSSRRRRVVYTFLFGFCEPFNDIHYQRDHSTDYVCFTDDPDLRSEFWHINHVPRGELGPARAAKQIKIQPHLFLSQYDASIYIDNTVRLKRPVSEFFDLLVRSRSPLVCLRHPWRDCVYDEAQAVIERNYDVPRASRGK